MNRASWRIGALIALACLPAWGCGDGAPPVESSEAEATVAGTVKVRGKPATKGTVTFDPSNIRRKNATARSAPIGKDGAYSITTLVGQNVVSVTTPETERDVKLEDNSEVFVAKGEGDLVDAALE